MKALVLAGGKGSRLRNQFSGPPKPLLEVGGKLLMDFSLQNAAAVGVDEIVVVVSAFTEAVVNHYRSAYRGIPITYKIQSEPKGVVHAIECAAGALHGADFLLMLADEIVLGPDHTRMIERFEQEKLFAALGVKTVTDRALISRTYSVREDGASGLIQRLVEKPRRPHNDVMGTGNCIFRHEILSYLDLCPINQARGERELPDLIQCAVDDGHPVKTHEVGTHYVNVNAPDDFEAAYTLLARYAATF